MPHDNLYLLYSRILWICLKHSTKTSWLKETKKLHNMMTSTPPKYRSLVWNLSVKTRRTLPRGKRLKTHDPFKSFSSTSGKNRKKPTYSASLSKINMSSEFTSSD